GRNFILFGRIVDGHQNCRGSAFSTFLFLHGLERDLDTPTTGWLIDADDRERTFKQFHRIADRYLAPIFPISIDNGLVAGNQGPPFTHSDAGDLRVLIKFNAVNQAKAKTGVTLVGSLADWCRGAHSRDLSNFPSMCRLDLECGGPSETDRARGPNH